jgi:hypothetical protein
MLLLSMLPFLERDARHIEQIRGASIPTGAVHAANQLEIRRVDVMLALVQDKFIADVHGQYLAKNQTAFAA